MYCVLFVLGKEIDNANTDSNNVVFTIKDTKFYISVVILSSKINQNFLLNDLKDQCTGMKKIKQKNLLKNLKTQQTYRSFFELKLVGVKRFFVLIFPKQDGSG